MTYRPGRGGLFPAVHAWRPGHMIPCKKVSSGTPLQSATAIHPSDGVVMPLCKPGRGQKSIYIAIFSYYFSTYLEAIN